MKEDITRSEEYEKQSVEYRTVMVQLQSAKLSGLDEINSKLDQMIKYQSAMTIMMGIGMMGFIMFLLFSV